MAEVFDVVTVSRLLGVIVPILVAVLAKSGASTQVKVWLNVVAAAILGAIAPVLAGATDYTFAMLINSVINTFLVSVAAYFGVFKPTGAADAIQQKTGTFGIGAVAEDPAE